MPRRTNPRHSDFDYRTSTAYFVTICTHGRQCLFGDVRRGRMVLNSLGRIVVEEWKGSEAMREEVILDAYVVMPNHMHGIVCLVPSEVDDVSPRGYCLDIGPHPSMTKNVFNEDGGRHKRSQDGVVDEEDSNDDVGPHGHAALREGERHLRWEDGRPQRYPKSLGSMIAGFKSAATTRINTHRSTPGVPVWQGRYHDRILRNEREWKACRRYIEQNPGRWGRIGIIPTAIEGRSNGGR